MAIYNVVKLQTTVKIIGCLSCVSFKFMVNYIFFYFINKIGSLLQFTVLIFVFLGGEGAHSICIH